jgi:hypothetical protein
MLKALSRSTAGVIDEESTDAGSTDADEIDEDVDPDR